MARELNSRFRWNITVLLAAAIFCVAGFAVSRTVLSSSGGSAIANTINATPNSRRSGPLPTVNGSDKTKQLAPTVNRGEIVFNIGGYVGSLYSITNVGSTNDLNNLTYTYERDPVFSPDGNKVLFASYRDGEYGSGNHQLYSMNPNGYDQRKLTDIPGFKESFAYSPDSSKIVFVCDGDLWTMTADGSGAVEIVDFQNWLSQPQYSPDGTKIIFVYEGTIWQVDADGTNGIELGNPGGKERARFSPDGTKIIFAANQEIYTMNSDGTNEVKIIDDDTVGHSLDIPVYSPDGTKILMECRDVQVNYCTADADGNNFQAFGGTVFERSYAAWSPDSSQVAFIARNSTTNTYGIYTSTIGGQPQLIYLENPGSPMNFLTWQSECPGAPTPTPTPTPTPSWTPIPGLISEWNANDLTADDSQGINHGQFVGDAILIDPGKRGLGFYFYDNGGRINVPDSNSLDVQTGDYTLSTWFNPMSVAEHYVAGKGACDGGSSNFYIGVDANFDPFIDISHSSGGTRVGIGGHTLTTNVWHSLILVKQGTSFKFFVDGVLAFNHIENGMMEANDQPFTIGQGIGCTSPQLTTKGGVDEVLLFGRALNGTEVSAIFNGYYPPVSPSPTPTPPPTNGLVGFWRANNDPTDAAGNNDGTLEGNTVYSAGHQGNAFDFDGDGDRVRVADNGNDNLDVQTGDFTVAAWVNIRSNGVHFIAGKDFDDGSYGLKVDAQALYFFLSTGGNYYYINTGSDITLNTWHHVAGVRSGGQIRVFVDGTERSSTTFTETLPANTTDFTIGGPVYGTSPQPDTNGLIDDVRLYNRGVDGTEMLAIYNDPGFAAIHKVSDTKAPGRTDLVCQPPADPSIQLRANYPFPVAAGRTGSMQIRLRDFAPTGGTNVAIAYPNSTSVSGPGNVVVPEGHNQWDFNFTTSPGTTFRTGDITAEITGVPGLTGDIARTTVTVWPAAPDVAASNLAAPSEVDILANFSAGWTVTNNGQASTNSYRQDTFYISPDDQLFNDGNDRIVGYSYDNSGVLAPGQSKSMTFNTVNIPAQFIPTDGTYYLFIYVGDAGTVQERNGNYSDNFMFVPIIVHRNLPDIVAENVAGPAEVEPGVLYTVNWDIANRGSAGSLQPFNHYVYFSYDQTVGNSDDVLLTQRFNAPFAVGQTASYGQQFILPTVPAKPSGDGLVYVKVDVSNQVYEDFPGGPAESNNVTTTPVRFEYRVPDLQVQSVTPPVEVESDTAFDLSWTTKNFGNKTASPINERVYFSTDAIVNANDLQIGSFALAQALAPNESVDRIQSVLIPTNAIAASGNYYVYVKTDADEQINEGVNENNNVTFHAIRVRRLLRPDLQVTSIDAGGSAFFDQEIVVQWTTNNSGNGPTNTPNWQDDLYIAPSQTLNGATRLSTLSNVSFLNAGESYIASATVRIPRSLNGSFYLIVRTDRDNSVNEENENNNLLTRPITINIPPVPDIGTSNVQAPETAFGGQPIAISWTTTNNGNGAVPANESTWYDAIYLSRNNILDGGDRYIGQRQHTGVLAANAAYTASGFNVDLPGDAFGDYFVFVVSDNSGQVYEFTGENNNGAYDQIAPGSPMHVLGTPPDLTVLSPITAPTSALAGQTINVQTVVRNQGAFDASGGWYDAVYISSDATFSPLTDIQIGSKYHTGLAAGQQYVNSNDVTIPNCLDGTFYLFGVADVNGQIFEYDVNGDAEANNVSMPKAIQITSFAPDLRVTGITIPPIVVNGAMPMSWTVKNFGTAATTQTAWTDRVYLYYQNQLIVLGTVDHQGALAINGEYTTNTVVYIPLFLEGEFTIFVRTDAYNYVPECSFDENNDASGLTQVNQDLPDMRITGANSPSSATLGGSFNVTWTGANQGTAMTQSTSWSDTVYLSTDATLAYGDTPIGGAVSSGQLGSGQSYGGNASVTIPNVAPGNYYLFVNADNGNNIVEGVNEINNSSTAIPITLTSPNVDLTVSNVTANPVLYSGQFADVSWTVTNNGASATVSSSWSDHVILSRDLVIDPSDRLIEYLPHYGVLNGGGSYTETRSVAIPAGLTGEYKIFVITDRNNQVVESNDANNMSSPLTVDLQLPPPAELNITNISIPPTISLGDTAAIGWTVQNSSANSVSGVWQDSVYLSSDQTWDSGDALIAQRQRSGTVGAFSTYSETLTTPIPPVELGVYYVIVRTDSRNNVRESIETNNISSSVGQTTVGVQNLTLGQALNTTLVTGQERYYSIFNTPGDETMLVTLNGQSGSRNELYTKFGSMVSRANYDQQGSNQGGANQENAVLNTTAGSYYTMARADLVPGSFAPGLKKADAEKANAPASPSAENVTLKAEILPFGVRRVSPASAGNEGLATLIIEGAKFQTGATLKLVAANNAEITPINLAVGNARMAAIFDLSGKPAGTYDVVVRNPNNQTSTLDDSFQIINGGGYILGSSIIAPGETRGGKTRLLFSARNDGLNDALNVPIIVKMPSAYNYQLDRGNFIDFPAADLPPDAIPEQIPTHFDVDGNRYVMLYAPILRSRSQVNIGIDLDIPLGFGGCEIEVQVLPPLAEFADSLRPNPPVQPYGPNLAPNASQAAKDCFLELFRQVFFAILNEVLPTDCLKAAWSIGASSLDLVSNLMLRNATGNQPSGLDLASILAQKFMANAGKLAECAGKSIPWFKAVSIIVTLIQLLDQLDTCLGELNSKWSIKRPRAFDPNEKVAPLGYGPEHFVPAAKPMLYRINFENLSSAAAPAQKIRIVDQLPATLDPRTMRLMEIGFKQYRVVVPENRAFFQTRLQLGADLNGLNADITAGLNIANGTVTWDMTAIDPATNERPLSPSVGILPPNNANHDGEGYVIFSVQPTANQPTRTNLANTASIFFDENEPIVTNTTANLLDSTLPSSSVVPLPPTTVDPNISLNWSGTDDPTDSGLKSFDVYVSENGRAFQPFLLDTTETSGIFNGNYGRSYRFYSVAHDNAGNLEEPPTIEDASISVFGGAYEGDVASRPNGTNDGTVNTQDVDQVRRFAAKLDTDYQYNEFQRADTSPIADGGDGSLSVADVIQTSRFSAGDDSVRTNAGPLAAASLAGKTIAGKDGNLLPRSIRPVIVSRTATKIVIGVLLEAQGDETGVGFTLNYNTADLSNPTNIVVGAGGAGAALTANTMQAGKVGIILDKLPSQPFGAGTRQIVAIEFDVSPTAGATTPITFNSDVVKNEIVNGTATGLTATFDGAPIVLLPPTAAMVPIAGRVVSSTGKAVKDTIVYLTDDQGFIRRTVTAAAGTYRFDDIEAGRTYVLSVRNKSFRFALPTRVINLTDAVEDADFVTIE